MSNDWTGDAQQWDDKGAEAKWEQDGKDEGGWDKGGDDEGGWDKGGDGEGWQEGPTKTFEEEVADAGAAMASPQSAFE